MLLVTTREARRKSCKISHWIEMNDYQSTDLMVLHFVHPVSKKEREPFVIIAVRIWNVERTGFGEWDLSVLWWWWMCLSRRFFPPLLCPRVREREREIERLLGPLHCPPKNYLHLTKLLPTTLHLHTNTYTRIF